MLIRCGCAVFCFGGLVLFFFVCVRLFLIVLFCFFGRIVSILGVGFVCVCLRGILCVYLVAFWLFFCLFWLGVVC